MHMQNFKIQAFCIAALVAFTGSLSAADEASSGSPAAVLVALDTTEGKIVIELDAEKAPKTVANFLDYVMSGHYEGTVFHRVIKDFMIQSGGMDENLKEKEVKPPVRNEAGNGLKNKKYTVAMARTNDPHSATSQFFINTADNGFLNREQAQDGFGYTVFGKVVEGMDVVDKIGDVKTNSHANPAFPAMLMRDVPATPITIKSAKVVGKQAE
jgi:cyclophilin family peptidyl-prolyl cis-trans isomerase